MVKTQERKHECDVVQEAESSSKNHLFYIPNTPDKFQDKSSDELFCCISRSPAPCSTEEAKVFWCVLIPTCSAFLIAIQRCRLKSSRLMSYNWAGHLSEDLLSSAAALRTFDGTRFNLNDATLKL